MLSYELVAVEIRGWSKHGTGGSFDSHARSVYVLHQKNDEAQNKCRDGKGSKNIWSTCND